MGYKEYEQHIRQVIGRRTAAAKPLLGFVDYAVALDVSPLDGGNDIVDRIRAKLAEQDTPTSGRSYDQQRMQERFLASCARAIYGNVYKSKKRMLLRRNKWGDVEPFCAICTPRRHGKSTALAEFLAALLYEVPGMTVCIYSTGARASQSGLLKLIKRALVRHGVSVFDTANQETLAFTVNGTQREVNAYKARADAQLGALQVQLAREKEVAVREAVQSARAEWEGSATAALSALQQAVREQRQVVFAKQTEIEHTKKEIRTRQDLHETISLQLARNEGGPVRCCAAVTPARSRRSSSPGSISGFTRPKSSAPKSAITPSPFF